MLENIPKIGFGTYKLQKGEEAYNAIRFAIENGYRHFDTASLYKTENDIGKAILDSTIDRNNFWITTKIHGSDISSNKVSKSIIKSMKNLDTKYLDLALLHFPLNDMEKNLNAWYVLEDYYRQGYLKNIGVSNYNIVHLETLLDNCSFL